MKKSDLLSSEFDHYFQRYINKLPNDLKLIAGFTGGKKNVIDFYNKIPTDKLDYKYQPEKWSIKEVLQHQIDTERIFLYRCFRIARKDNTPLAGFDQDTYIMPSEANNKSIGQLLNEFKINRNNSIALLKSLTENNLKFIGVSSGKSLSSRAAAYIILGHDTWHQEIIVERYL